MSPRVSSKAATAPIVYLSNMELLVSEILVLTAMFTLCFSFSRIFGSNDSFNSSIIKFILMSRFVVESTSGLVFVIQLIIENMY